MEKNLLQELLTFSPFLFSTPLPVILWSQLLQRSLIGYPLAVFHWFSLFLANKGMSFLLPAIESAQLLTLVQGLIPSDSLHVRAFEKGSREERDRKC